jgi:tRNA splicing ligase
LLKIVEKMGINENNFAEDLFKKKISLIFEVINPGISLFFIYLQIDFDPHIIQYKEAVLVLLDVVENRLTAFNRYGTENRESLAEKYGFKAKKLYK